MNFPDRGLRIVTEDCNEFRGLYGIIDRSMVKYLSNVS